MATVPASQPYGRSASPGAASSKPVLAVRASSLRNECWGGAAAAQRGRGVRPPPAAANQRAGPASPGPPARGVCEDALLVAECQSRGAVAVVPAATREDAEHRTSGAGRSVRDGKVKS